MRICLWKYVKKFSFFWVNCKLYVKLSFITCSASIESTRMRRTLLRIMFTDFRRCSWDARRRHYRLPSSGRAGDIFLKNVILFKIWRILEAWFSEILTIFGPKAAQIDRLRSISVESYELTSFGLETLGTILPIFVPISQLSLTSLCAASEPTIASSSKEQNTNPRQPRHQTSKRFAREWAREALTKRFNIANPWKVSHDIAELKGQCEKRVDTQHGPRRDHLGAEAEAYPTDENLKPVRGRAPRELPLSKSECTPGICTSRSAVRT